MVRPFNPMMLNKDRRVPLPKKKDKGPKKTPREKMLLYMKMTLSGILVGGLTSLMFLSLIVVDPALSTIAGNFVERSVECHVVHSEYVLGMADSVLAMVTYHVLQV